jgi:hypothetical protein
VEEHQQGQPPFRLEVLRLVHDQGVVAGAEPVHGASQQGLDRLPLRVPVGLGWDREVGLHPQAPAELVIAIDVEVRDLGQRAAEEVGQRTVEAGEQRALALRGQPPGLLRRDQGLAGTRRAGDRDPAQTSQREQDHVLAFAQLEDLAIRLLDQQTERLPDLDVVCQRADSPLCPLRSQVTTVGPQIERLLHPPTHPRPVGHVVPVDQHLLRCMRQWLPAGDGVREADRVAEGAPPGLPAGTVLQPPPQVVLVLHRLLERADRKRMLPTVAVNREPAPAGRLVPDAAALHLQHQQAAIGMDDDEVGLAVPGPALKLSLDPGDVVEHRVAGGQGVVQSLEDLALRRAPREPDRLRDHPRHRIPPPVAFAPIPFLPLRVSGHE